MAKFLHDMTSRVLNEPLLVISDGQPGLWKALIARFMVSYPSAMECLEKGLEEAGINYLYIGKELGGYRKGGYEAYMHTGDFLSGIEELEGNARVDRTVFVCAEGLPRRCHRRFIGQVLEKKGWEVIHIIDEKRVWRPKD